MFDKLKVSAFQCHTGKDLFCVCDSFRLVLISFCFHKVKKPEPEAKERQ